MDCYDTKACDGKCDECDVHPRPVAVQPEDPRKQQTSEGPVPSVNGRGEGSATTCGGITAPVEELAVVAAGIIGLLIGDKPRWFRTSTLRGATLAKLENIEGGMRIVPGDETVAHYLARPTAVQPEPATPHAPGSPPAELLKAENAALRRERDALRASLGRVLNSQPQRSQISGRMCLALEPEVEAEARALASETGGASTKKS